MNFTYDELIMMHDALKEKKGEGYSILRSKLIKEIGLHQMGYYER